jgi:CubicO group peptidase (beta-lactamase class C family)
MGGERVSRRRRSTNISGREHVSNATRFAAHCASVALTSLLMVPASARSAPETLVAQTDNIFALWNKSDSSGCACGVMKRGELIYAKGFGVADLEHDIPLTADSVFYIASTSKQFTAASVGLLVLDGKVALKDDIRKFLPEIRDYGSTISVEQLLHHTSGVRDYLELVEIAGRGDFDKLDNDMAIRLLARQKSLNFTPGSQHLYSNSNYVMLAEIVKRASGIPMSRFAKERIFLPLGMNSTRFGNDVGEIVPNRVISYGETPDGRHFQFIKTIEAYGDGNLLTTVRDLARWQENFYSGKVGGPVLLNLLRTRGVLNDGKSTNYGFGLVFGKHRGVAFEGHGGAFLGFRTELLRFPDQHFSVTVLCNFASANAGGLARQVADLYLVGVTEPPKNVAKSFTEIRINPTTFDAYTGSYAIEGSAPRFVMTFTRKGDKYFAQASGQPRFEILPFSQSDFFFKAVDAQVTFHHNANGTVNRLTLHQFEDRDAHRIEPFSPTVAMLAEFTGTYYSDELDAAYHLLLEEDRLIARDPRDRPVPLEPTAQDVFGVPGAEVRFRRNASGTVNGFVYSSGRVLNLAFERNAE